MSERSEALSKDIEGNNEACCIDGIMLPIKNSNYKEYFEDWS